MLKFVNPWCRFCIKEFNSIGLFLHLKLLCLPHFPITCCDVTLNHSLLFEFTAPSLVCISPVSLIVVVIDDFHVANKNNETAGVCWLFWQQGECEAVYLLCFPMADHWRLIQFKVIQICWGFLTWATHLLALSVAEINRCMKETTLFSCYLTVQKLVSGINSLPVCSSTPVITFHNPACTCFFSNSDCLNWKLVQVWWLVWGAHCVLLVSLDTTQWLRFYLVSFCCEKCYVAL